MYERFTNRARKVMQLANQESQRFNHDHLDGEQILIGLLAEGEGVAAHVLKALGADLQVVRGEIEKLVPPGPNSVLFGKMPLTSHAEQVIEDALTEASALDHNYVGTEHLLMALVLQKGGVAAKVLTKLGLKLEDVRQEVLNLLGHGQ
jgi:ATP-dependent Clp protease ATP-binding subunit ClpC